MQNRNPEIDVTKGILTIGMVFAHVYQLLGNRQNNILESIDYLINWASFSGFLFCFGFVSWIAYLQKVQLPWNNILRTTFKCYIAFIISGVAYRMLIDSETASLALLFRIAAIRDIPAHSEFLLAFAVVTIFGAIFKKYIHIMTMQWKNLLLSTTICLALPFFMPSIPDYDPLISLFIGNEKFLVYPIIQYFPIFLFGAFVARNQKWFNMRSYLFFSLFGLGILIAGALLNMPITRFPPSPVWILSSIGFVFLYRGFAEIIWNKFPNIFKQYLNVVGQNVLFYLLVSNLIIFVGVRLNHQLSDLQTLLFFVLLMSFVYIIQLISADFKRVHPILDKPG